MYNDIQFEPKGGNSPVRFFFVLNGEKIGLAKKSRNRFFQKDIWRVKVFKPKYIKEISDYMHIILKVEILLELN